MSIRDELQEEFPDTDLLFMTEEIYDDAIIGVANRIDMEPTIAYDEEKVIDINMGRGMTYEEAIEYFQYNQIGAYVGKQTPIFIKTFKQEDENIIREIKKIIIKEQL